MDGEYDNITPAQKREWHEDQKNRLIDDPKNWEYEFPEEEDKKKEIEKEIEKKIEKETAAVERSTEKKLEFTPYIPPKRRNYML